MNEFFAKVKQQAMVPILGIPTFVYVVLVALGSYMLLGKKKGRGRRLF